MENNYELKAYKYKIKYLNLKNKNNSQIAGSRFKQELGELKYNQVNINEGVI